MYKSLKFSFVFFFVISCTKNSTDTISNDTSAGIVEQDSTIAKDKFTIKELLNQSIDASDLELGSKNNLNVFNGFKGLKLGLNFDKIILENKTKVIVDKTLLNHNYKEVSFERTDEIKSGKGSIQFLKLFFLDNLLQSMEINQTESWSISNTEYAGGRYSSGLQNNSFIEIFSSAFGTPDVLQYSMGIMKPINLHGNLKSNLEFIDHQFLISNKDDFFPINVDLGWENDEIRYFLTVSHVNINAMLQDQKDKSLSTKSWLFIENKSTKKLLHQLQEEILELENMNREKKQQVDIIKSKKNAIESL